MRDFMLENRIYLIENLRKPVHRDGEKDEIILLNDPLQIVGRENLR